MPDDPRVQQLLDELLESQSTPEEVCGSCVELLPVVRERWRQMCQARAELDAMFPPEAELGESLPAFPAGDTALPVIPGYEVDARLGVGGMGVVFRARHLRLNRVVALKMTLAGAHAGTHERERFQREAEAVAALRHPNVVQVHDVGDSAGRPYFTMEFVEGGSLNQKLAGTPLPAQEAATLVATLAGAVHAAHRSGIVHRDLKPANVLLTADGVPKISDFGLARRLGGEAGLTRTGTAVGTPSYMAPEQARGTADAAGPPADIYALGAILYELLTGRPPFRAETGAETVHQLLTQDPVPPSRLNGKVPRDLETICLKCLHKEPRLRYATAAAIADDLDRFLRGDAIMARPEGLLARLARRVRRRPALSAAIAATALSTITLVGGGVWTLSEREANRRAVEAEEATLERAADADLKEMAEYLQKSSWLDAKTTLERVRGRLGNRGSAELHRRLDRSDRELTLGLELDAISLRGSFRTEGVIDFPQADKDYEAAFREFGQVYEDPEIVAGRIASSTIEKALVEALDHWALRVSPADPKEPDPPRMAWILQVARATVKRRADPDPTGWRDRARDPAIWKNEAQFTKLIEETPFAQESVALLVALTQQLNNAGKPDLPFLKRIQAAHPGDFWANNCLALSHLRSREYGEAICYLRAALAIRPRTAVVHKNLGHALLRLNRTEEAVDHFRKSLELGPGPAARRGLAVALAGQGPSDAAVVACRNAIEEFPNDALLHTLLGTALREANRNDEALRAYQQAIALDPNRWDAHVGIRRIYLRQGLPEEARVAWGKVLDTRPPDHQDWYGYAELCLYLGKEDEYRRARKRLLQAFGAATDPYLAERTGRACLLRPLEGNDLRLAAALTGRAAAVDRSLYPGTYPYFQFAMGLAEYRQGRFDRAIAVMRGDAASVPNPAPRLVLAMALHQSGQVAEARKTLAVAISGHDWRANNVRDQDGWIYHSLRREAEGMIVPNLPAFLEGKYQPRDNQERLAFLGECQFRNRNRDQVRLYTDIFAAVPSLADDLNAGHRFSAARAAALAGCGQGQDAVGLGDLERAQFRKQARDWLSADVARCKMFLDRDLINARLGVRDRLTRLGDSPDLAGLRDPAELGKLSADERKEFLALWNEIAIAIKRTENRGK